MGGGPSAVSSHRPALWLSDAPERRRSRKLVHFRDQADHVMAEITIVNDESCTVNGSELEQEVT